MRKRIGLQRLITLSVLSIGLLIGTIGLAYAYWHAKQSLRQTVGFTFQELARQSAENVGLLLTKDIEWVEQLSALPVIRSAALGGARVSFDDPELRRLREEHQRYFSSMIIVDRNSRSVGGITSGVTRTHYRQQPWWPLVFDQGRPWSGNLNRDDVGRWHWEVAVPIRATDRRVVGALKVVIGREDLLVPILRSRIGQTGHVMLLDEGGEVLACRLLEPTRHTRFPGFGLDGKPRDTIVPMEAVWSEIGLDTHQGRGGIVGLAPVRLRSDVMLQRRWAVLVQQDPAETYAPLVILTKRLALFGMIAIGCIALLRWRLARRIAKPINALVERVQRLGQAHNAQPPIPGPPTGIVEIDALSASFDELTERLDRASRERQRYVTDLESANRELAISEQHYRMLWDHSVDTKLLVDGQGIIRDVNRRGEIKLWKRAVRLIGTSVEDLFHQDDRPRVRRVLQDVFVTRKEAPAGELRVLSPTEGIFTMDVDAVPVENAGSLVAVMLQLSDLTEKKRLEEQLVRSERLASLSQFASMFAHDIRNPLVGIKKTLELLGSRAQLQADPEKQWCEDMRFTTDLLLGMINDMLDVYQENYSGLPLLTSTISVKTVVDEVTHLFRTESTAKEVSFRMEVPEGDISVTADGRRLLRVLINLVHNALKFSPAGGVITVSVREDADGPPSRAGGETSPPVVTIQVADEGPGIAAPDLPRVFEMFFKKKDEQEMRLGRGLGLHFCRLVVEAHHGRIWAANRPSGGAVFSIELPVQQGVYVGQSADR